MIEFKISVKEGSKSRVGSYVQGLFLLLGVVGVSYGFYLAWSPLGFLVGGLCLFGIGLLMNKISSAKENIR